jgi:hypothetical protein
MTLFRTELVVGRFSGDKVTAAGLAPQMAETAFAAAELVPVSLTFFHVAAAGSACAVFGNIFHTLPLSTQV